MTRWDHTRQADGSGLTWLCAKKNGQRSAKAASRQGRGRRRKGVVGAVSGGHAGRTVASAPGSSPLGRFLHALRQEKIPFLIAGMTAAVLQGVPVVTTDVDFWIGTPQNEHDRVLILCHRLGATMFTDHIVELPDGAQLNFAYSMDGLKSFAVEKRRARELRWM